MQTVNQRVPGSSPGASTILRIIACAALLGGVARAEEVPYSFELSALAQRYYRLCRADARLQEQVARDLNERRLPIPQTRSFLESLPAANRRDAQLVCLGAAAQHLDDLQSPPVAVLPPDAAPLPASDAVAPATPPRPAPPPPRRARTVRISVPHATIPQKSAAPAPAPFPRPAPRVTIPLEAPR